MKAMQDLTRERQGLTVELVTRHSVKKWGDWELEEYSNSYKNGRIQQDRKWKGTIDFGYGYPY